VLFAGKHGAGVVDVAQRKVDKAMIDLGKEPFPILRAVEQLFTLLAWIVFVCGTIVSFISMVSWIIHRMPPLIEVELRDFLLAAAAFLVPELLSLVLFALLHVQAEAIRLLISLEEHIRLTHNLLVMMDVSLNKMQESVQRFVNGAKGG